VPDDYTSGSLAALAGGKTTISNFINQEANTDLRTTLTEAADLVKKQAIADVILRFTASDPTKLSPSDVAMLYDRGFDLKIFLVRPTFDQNAASYVKLIRAAGAAGLLTMLHCEDASIVTTTQERMVAEGRGALKGQNFAESRPFVAEEIATQRAVGISEATGAPIYIERTDAPLRERLNPSILTVSRRSALQVSAAGPYTEATGRRGGNHETLNGSRCRRRSVDGGLRFFRGFSTPGICRPPECTCTERNRCNASPALSYT
jgi:hypothetical protein